MACGPGPGPSGQAQARLDAQRDGTVLHIGERPGICRHETLGCR